MQQGSQPEGAWNYPSVGRWGITALPEGWMLVPGFGARQIGDNREFIVSNIALSHDPLPEGKTLVEYIEKQRALIEAKYAKTKFAGPQAVSFQNAEEAYMLLIRQPARQELEMVHVQHYARVANWIGIVTLTTPEQALRTVRPAHEMFVKGLYILPQAPQPKQQQYQ